MKKLLIILLFFLLACQKEQCRCVRYYSPILIKPEVFYTADPWKYDGKVIHYVDHLGNIITEVIICDTHFEPL